MNVENLKSARKKSGLTQQEVANAIGVVQSAYRNYEQGNREPKGDTIVMLADLFHVTTDYLLRREVVEEETIDKLAYEFDMSALEKKITEGYFELPKYQREIFMDFLERMVDEVHAEAAENKPSEPEASKTLGEDLAAELSCLLEKTLTGKSSSPLRQGG